MNSHAQKIEALETQLAMATGWKVYLHKKGCRGSKRQLVADVDWDLLEQIYSQLRTLHEEQAELERNSDPKYQAYLRKLDLDLQYQEEFPPLGWQVC